MSSGLIALNIGKPKTQTYQGREIETGIHKDPVQGRIYLSTLNLDGDGQADLVHHGGVDKALCAYPHEHYSYWEKDIGQTLSYGAFGENLTTKGLSEDEVCIGDIFCFGEAFIQISQPRRPCFKVAARYNVPDFTLRIQRTGYTGFYFRVLKEGWVAPDSPLHLIERHPAGVSVTFANQCKYHDISNVQALQTLLAVRELSASWRAGFEKQLEALKPY
ncbi:MOSC domain-containing protein [Aneurinibacillus sp. REN35]|uniref:MOSC domain-containing protein n=1 Tax=Aneurinibacillus sp. REN35 TaxID=3237286 RepID=UPI0035287335